MTNIKKQDTITTKTQVNSLTESSLHICLSPFAVPVHTWQSSPVIPLTLRHSVLFTYPFLTLRSLSPHSTITNPHMFLSLYYSFLLVTSWWLSDCYCVFSYHRKVKMFVRIVRSVVFLWLATTRNIWRPERKLSGHQNGVPSNQKSGTVLEKRD